MRGINRLYELGASLETLSQLGLQIGTDVPFCIYNKTAICKGRGEKIKFLDKPPSAWVVLAKPNLGISSPDIFKELNLKRIMMYIQKCVKKRLDRRLYEIV